MAEVTKKKKVIIMGGGVAALSAAHHLLQQAKDRFEVEIYERRDIGGKARSDEENNLPNEHGFRFFPGFYKHITKTMKQIKLEGGGNVYCNNLVDTETYTFLFSKKPGRLDVPINIGSYISKLKFTALKKKLDVLRRQKEEVGIDITREGVNRFTESMLEVYTTCNARIDSTYDNISWSDYIDAKDVAGKYGRDYDDLLATGISKNLVAVRADVANARTGAKLIGHMLWHIVSPFALPADKLLNAPTNVAWIDPWVKYLEEKGLKIHHNRRVVGLTFDPKKACINGMLHDHVESIHNVEDPDLKGRVWKYYEDLDSVPNLKLETADYFICAMPIERIDEILQRSKYEGKRIKKFDPTLRKFKKLWENTEWMSGLIFYFDTEIDIARGHITIADEEAAVTMVSQCQFWTDYLKRHPVHTKNGVEVKAILSVIVSNWDAESKYIERKGKKLKDLGREEVLEEIKEMLFNCEIEKNKKLEVYRQQLVGWFLDNSIRDFDAALANPRYESIEREYSLYNNEPLFINKTHSYHLRPTVYTFFKNFFLASDYVKTNADLGCMDSADEAARRVANSIFRREKIKKYLFFNCFRRVNLYKLPSLIGLFDTARLLDYRCYKKGIFYKRNFIRGLLKWFAHLVLNIVESKIPRIFQAIILLFVALVLGVICLLNLIFMMLLKLFYVTGI